MADNDELQHHDDLDSHVREVQHLLARHKLVEDLVHRQEMPKHELVESLVHKQHIQELTHKLDSLHSADVAHILEALPVDERLFVWDLVKAERDGEILLEVSDAVRESLIESMDPDSLRAAAEQLDADELADLAPDLPQAVMEAVYQGLDQEEREQLRAAMSYPDDSVGALMDFEMVTVREDVTLEVVLRYLRRRGSLPEKADAVFVVDSLGRYMGLLYFSRLLTGSPETPVLDVMDAAVDAFPATQSAADVARRFQDRDLIIAAVVDERGRLVGQITIDDVVDVIADQADHEILSNVGLDEEDDMFAPVLTSSRRRAIWLALHLVLAYVTAGIINLFQDTIDKVVILAVLMPMVATMGGIAGSQTLTLMVRGQALGRVRPGNALSLLRRELAVGAVNGLGWALIVSVTTAVLFGSWAVGAVVAAALAINMLMAAIMGCSIPLLLDRLRIDPALAGSVVLITLTDTTGFVAVLGLGALFLV